MKYSAHLLTPSLIASLALVIPATAEPAAAQPAAEPAAEPAAGPAGAEVAAKAEAKPFLGLGTCEVPDFLAKHLKLAENSGVLVRDVAPDSPASTAGIEIDDVITEVDGKGVSCHQEMVDQIRSKKPGDAVELKFIHEGSPGKASVKLGVRPAELDQGEGQIEGQIEGVAGEIQLPELPGNVPQDLQKKIREAMEKGLKGGGMQLQIIPGEGGLQVVPGNMGNGGPGAGRVPQDGIQFKMASSVNMMDDQGSIELKNTGDGSEVKVRDKAGKEVWSGPWDTEQDKAAAPAAIRERIAKLNVQVGPGVQMRAQPAPKVQEKQPAPEEQPADAPAKP